MANLAVPTYAVKIFLTVKHSKIYAQMSRKRKFCLTLMSLHRWSSTANARLLLINKKINLIWSNKNKMLSPPNPLRNIFLVCIKDLFWQVLLYMLIKTAICFMLDLFIKITLIIMLLHKTLFQNSKNSQETAEVTHDWKI